MHTILRSGEPITGVEVSGQRPDESNTERVWVTYWHPLKNGSGGNRWNQCRCRGNYRPQTCRVRSRGRARSGCAYSTETLAERVEARYGSGTGSGSCTQDLLIVTDLSGRVVSVNPAWSARPWLVCRRLVGQSAERLIHPEDRDRSFAGRAYRSGTKTPHFENRLMGKDGSYRLLSWFAAHDGGLIYAGGRDVTDLKKPEEQFHTLRGELADASRHAAMGVMTASIAHEIKQPLAGIVTNANAGLRWLKRPDPN